MYPVPTVAINVGDLVQYQGVSYNITNVGAAVLNAAKDRYTYALTISVGIIQASANNIILSAVNTIGRQFWVFSA
jgi:hypothetical protein